MRGEGAVSWGCFGEEWGFEGLMVGGGGGGEMGLRVVGFAERLEGSAGCIGGGAEGVEAWEAGVVD